MRAASPAGRARPHLFLTRRPAGHCGGHREHRDPGRWEAHAATGFSAGDVVGKIAVGRQDRFGCAGDGAPVNGRHYGPRLIGDAAVDQTRRGRKRYLLEANSEIHTTSLRALAVARYWQ
jgi:hypothetical protein